MIFANSGAHGVDDDLRLGHGADTKMAASGISWCRSSTARSAGDAVGGNIDQNYIGSEGLGRADDGVGRRHRQTGVGVHGAGHAGAIDQDLQHGALIVIGGDNGD